MKTGQVTELTIKEGEFIVLSVGGDSLSNRYFARMKESIPPAIRDRVLIVSSDIEITVARKDSES